MKSWLSLVWVFVLTASLGAAPRTVVFEDCSVYYG